MPFIPKTQAKNPPCPCGHPENRTRCDRWACPFLLGEVLGSRMVRNILVFEAVAIAMTLFR